MAHRTMAGRFRLAFRNCVSGFLRRLRCLGRSALVRRDGMAHRAMSCSFGFALGVGIDRLLRGVFRRVWRALARGHRMPHRAMTGRFGFAIAQLLGRHCGVTRMILS